MTTLRISDDDRRIRLMARHRLAPGCAASSVEAVAEAMIGLHATTASTVYLAARARMSGFTPAAMDAALYDNRSLVKHLCMRRTLFVMTRPVLDAAIGAVGPRVTASERTNMLRDLRRSDDFDDPEAWIDTAVAAVADELSDGRVLTSTELRQRLPALDGTVVYAPDKSWGGTMPMGPRVLNMMSAAGQIVRGPNRAHWSQSRPTWSSMAAWLGAAPEPMSVHDGHLDLVRRWLWTFGPGTETDITWWLGSTKTAVRKALAELDVVEVDLDSGERGYVLADDADPRGSDERDLVAADLGARLLPELDPTTMGHKQRAFYLGEHGAHVFDRNGNGGQTAWWGGRIVGGWRQESDGAITVHPLERLPRAASKALAAEAEQLAEWLADVRLRPAYPAPFMR